MPNAVKVPGIAIRTARREDVPAIVRLLADDALGATREQPGEPLAQEYWDAWDAMVKQTGNEVLVADKGGEVVGCLQLTIIPGLSRFGMTRGLIEGVRVGAHHRGKRIGELLVHAAIERSREQGCKMVQLTTDRTRGDAKRFYERLGFQSTHLGMKLSLS
ncbi:MAG TPA: GNAT family N-acetyltransferase [Gemmatimonadaceae bacterium]|nr:GNAT family N-acetyltransferase [Gemmatimonadaceae bacterium]